MKFSAFFKAVFSGCILLDTTHFFGSFAKLLFLNKMLPFNFFSVSCISLLTDDNFKYFKIIRSIISKQALSLFLAITSVWSALNFSFSFNVSLKTRSKV